MYLILWWQPSLLFADDRLLKSNQSILKTGDWIILFQFLVQIKVDGRHIFCHLALLKVPFRRMKAFFHKILSSANFHNFSKVEISRISRKIRQFRMKRLFYEIISFDTHSTEVFCHLYQLWNIYFFEKKTNFVHFERFLLHLSIQSHNISVAFQGEFAIKWW